ncbi:MAG: hypothetical protein ACOCVI_03335 [Planctomycetota bacterium]
MIADAPVWLKGLFLVTAVVLALGVGVQALRRIDPTAVSADDEINGDANYPSPIDFSIPHVDPNELPDPLGQRFDRIAGLSPNARRRMVMTFTYQNKPIEDWIDRFVAMGRPGVATFRRGGVRIRPTGNKAEYRVTVELIVRAGPEDVMVFSDWIVDTYLGKSVPVGTVSSAVILGDIHQIRVIVRDATER